MNNDPETTESNGTAPQTEDPNSRYRLISKPKARLLRRVMQETLATKYEGSLPDMATALSMAPNGLKKIFENKQGTISERTLHRYMALTNWSPDAPEEAEPHTNGAKKKPMRSNFLPDDELTTFRDELRQAVEEHGATNVARKMGSGPGALRLILSGKGSTYKMLARFRAYKEGKKVESSRPPHTNGVASTHTLERRPVSSHMGPDVDLYRLACRLLDQERVSEAHVLSLVAQVSESVPLARITDTLKQLLAG